MTFESSGFQETDCALNLCGAEPIADNSAELGISIGA
jgi:hypothetical protein